MKKILLLLVPALILISGCKKDSIAIYGTWTVRKITTENGAYTYTPSVVVTFGTNDTIITTGGNDPHRFYYKATSNSITTQGQTINYTISGNSLKVYGNAEFQFTNDPAVKTETISYLTK